MKTTLVFTRVVFLEPGDLIYVGGQITAMCIKVESSLNMSCRALTCLHIDGALVTRDRHKDSQVKRVLWSGEQPRPGERLSIPSLTGEQRWP